MCAAWLFLCRPVDRCARHIGEQAPLIPFQAVDLLPAIAPIELNDLDPAGRVYERLHQQMKVELNNRRVTRTDAARYALYAGRWNKTNISAQQLCGLQFVTQNEWS